jgi:hypothetical protein
MVDKLIEGGHDSADSFGQNVPSAEILEQLLEYYLVGEGRVNDIPPQVKASNWKFAFLAGCVRKVWRSAQAKAADVQSEMEQEASKTVEKAAELEASKSAAKVAELDAARAASEAAVKAAEAQLALVQASVAGASQGSLVPFSIGKAKRTIDTLEREKMRQEAEKKFTGLKIVQNLPSVSYLQSIVNQNDAFVWNPWNKILSEEKEKEVLARKGGKKELLDLMAESAGIWELEWDGSRFHSPHCIQNLLYTRAHAYCVAGKCHFGSWSVYIKKFVAEYAHHTAPNLGLRSPNGVEAEEADRAAMTKIFDLCLSQEDWTLDQAIWEIVENRNFLSQVLGHRRKDHRQQEDRRRRREKPETWMQRSGSSSPPPLKRGRTSSAKGGSKGGKEGKGGKGEKRRNCDKRR